MYPGLRSLLLVVLMACGSTSGTTTAADASREVVLREAEAGARAVVARDGELMIDLEAVPGTGYSWSLTQHDAALLELLSDEMVAGEEEPGARERHQFRFRTLAPGTSAIELEYRRPFEKDQPPEQTYRVTIEVR